MADSPEKEILPENEAFELKSFKEQEVVESDQEEENAWDYSQLLSDWKRPKDLVVDRLKESLPIPGSKSQSKALESSLSALVTIISEERRGLK
jgi:hypothetical protein